MLNVILLICSTISLMLIVYIQVDDSAELLFSEVLNALHKISGGRPITGSFDGNLKILELRRNIGELEEILLAEKADFMVK